MHRRRLLRYAGLAGGTLLAGCMGAESESFKLKVTDKEIGQDGDGNLVFNATISNPGNEAQEGTLYVTATLNGNESVKLRDVSLEAHETKRITVTYDIKYLNVTEFTADTDIQPKE